MENENFYQEEAQLKEQGLTAGHIAQCTVHNAETGDEEPATNGGAHDRQDGNQVAERNGAGEGVEAQGSEPAGATGDGAEAQGSEPAGATSEGAEAQGSEPGITRVDLEEVLAAAERRGYLKGRNERIEELMSRPRELEAPVQSAQTLILNHIRRSIWD